LAYLQVAGVGRGLPVDVPGALQGFIRPNAVKIVAAPALEQLQFAAHSGQQRFEPRLRIQARIYQNLVAGGNQFAPFGESERKPGGELEAALLLGAPAGEVNIDGFFHRGATRENRKVKNRVESALRRALEVNAEGRNPALRVLEAHARADFSAGGKVLGEEKLALPSRACQTADRD